MSQLGPVWQNIAGNHCGRKKIAFSVSDTWGTLENKLNNLKPLFDLFSHKKCFTFQKRSKKMLLHIRGQILLTRINNNRRKLICLSWPLSLKQTFDWHMSVFLTSWANQVLHLLASRGFQNPGVCLQAFPSSPRSRSFIFWLLFHMWTAKPKIHFLCLSFLWSQMETLSTRATQGQTPRLQDVGWKVRWSRIVQDELWGPSVLFILETKRKLHGVNFCKDFCSLNASSWPLWMRGRKRKESLRLRLWNLNSTSNSPVVAHLLSCQISPISAKLKRTQMHVNKHWKTRAN